ncbi:MAG: glycine cleavage system aminomethyltransferase GcvT [Rikenellaceae bacterium]|nr:glycine cleavage system aminomethyltransferase GcvT [Rikenellaceae bacterium]MDE7356590.1 glycine cleavage system aminomethyltransferase GcvT [Rikenellaceae bacterium]
MKTTPFTKYHIEAGAKMAPFAGYNMPIEFTGINDEHICVRERLGVFDVSHMGEIWVKGPKAEAFLQHVTSNNVALLYDGKVQYSCFPNGKGGIVDDLLVYRINAETYLLVVNASNIDKDWNFLCSEAAAYGLTPGKELYNASDEIAQLAVQGPLAMKAIQKLVNEPVEDMEYYTFKKVDIAGIKEAILSITGYTGAGGCEIYVAAEDADKLWNAVFEAGKEFGIQPIGLGARDTLRLEMGFCLYGNDIDDTTSPIEAGLGWITKFVDGKDFIDRAKMESLKAEGVKRKLIGFEMIDKGVPRHDYPIVDAEGKNIGRVTSGTMSPSLKKGIGMGYVETAFSKAGTEIFIEIRGRKLKAEVVKTPFYKQK